MSHQTHDRLGTVVRDGDRISLAYERRLRQPPEKVWRALTESENLRHWFPADIVGERRTGASVTLPFWPDGAEASKETLERAGVEPSSFDFDEALPGTIQTYDPPRLFELVWGNPEGEPDILRFELEPADGGTRLLFTTWPGEPGPLGHGGTGAGWHACLDALEHLVNTGTAGDPDQGTIMDLQKQYTALVDQA